MMAREKSRIYEKRGRYYADFRDLDGRLEALRPKGERHATTDRDIAEKLCSDRVRELEQARQDQAAERRDGALGIRRPTATPLKTYAAQHLIQKAQDREVSKSSLQQAEKHLREAVKFFGAATPLESLTPADMQLYVAHLRKLPHGRKGNRYISDATVRHYLNALSNLYTRACADVLVPSNPVAMMYSRPTSSRAEPEYWGPEEAALLLESARTYQPRAEDHHAFPYMYPLVATLLLTGMRKGEVFGLEVDDVSFKLDRFYLRPNKL